MTASFRRHAVLLTLCDRASRLAAVIGVTFLFAFLTNCGSSSDGLSPSSNITVKSITIDGGSRALERGTKLQLTATVLDTGGKPITVPLVWRSSADSVVAIDKDGKLVAGDTGLVVVIASALGVTAQPIQIQVVWFGPANVAAFHFTAPNAVTPAAVVNDSLRVLVTNRAGGSTQNALVQFAVKAGNGTVSQRFVKTGANGLAATQWTLGADAGVNTVTATVVQDDSTTVTTWAAGNPVSFSITTYAALSVVRGDAQTGQLLAALPITPAVKLVDVNGAPRPGVTVVFTPTSNGRVAAAAAQTGADGTVSPGAWTLGDAAGDEQLIVTVENARLVMHATATGTATRFAAANVATSQAATCARTGDELVSCLGSNQLTGRGDANPRSTPGATTGNIHFKSIVGGQTHFCGVATDASLYCWGPFALADTTGAANSSPVPARVGSSLSWAQVTAGGQHNCALTNDGAAYCWGDNTVGQLGDNGTANRATLRVVAGGFQFKTLTSGSGHSCGLSTDNKLFCWGSNSSAQLGDGTGTDRRTPTAVSSPEKFIAVGAGSAWTCALNEGGKAECWGAATGHTAPQAFATAPVFTSLTVGAAHACALTSDGVAYCWGDNTNGQLGDSTQVVRTDPTAVVTPMRFTSISAGVAHTCGITTDGAVACWGNSQSGEIGVDSQSKQLTPRFIVTGVQP